MIVVLNGTVEDLLLCTDKHVKLSFLVEMLNFDNYLDGFEVYKAGKFCLYAI